MRPVTEDTVKAFAALFKGRTDVWGTVEGMAVKEPVTLEHYRRHLAGEKSLGIYPLLDDGTCWFWAVDLDEKSFEKIHALRKEFSADGINTYIAASKSKGFHLYGFNDAPVPAKLVREMISRLETKLNIKTEIFPKQDKLDDLIPFGNYINVPCHGFTRSFLASDGSEVPVEKAVQLIQKNSLQAIKLALLALPEIKLPTIKLPTRPVSPPKKPRLRSPPCIEQLMKGVNAGARDMAAFALARHWLDQGITPSEVQLLLESWDGHNNPPIHDLRQLETKLRSAEKGYAFGCSSILKEPQLAGACVGRDVCEWIKKDQKDKKKRGLLVMRARLPNLVDIVTRPAPPDAEDHRPEIAFLMGKDGKFQIEPTTTIGPVEIRPPGREHMPYILPEAETTINLIQKDNDHDLFMSVLAFMKKASEMPKDEAYDLLSWWVMHTYLYERFDYSPIVAFIGAPERGKSRCGRAITMISYRGIETETLREACLFRWSENLGATIFLDVMDLEEKADRANSMDIILKRYEAGGKVGRVLYPDKGPFEDLVYFDIFGPTVIATNVPIHYILDSRCLGIIMPVAKKKFWPSLDVAEATSLKNRLVAFRARHMYDNLPEFSKPKPGRFGDILQPLGQLMKMTVPEREERFKTVCQWLWEERLANKSSAPEAKALIAIDKAQLLLGLQDASFLTVAQITTEFNDGLAPRYTKSPDAISRLIGSLGFDRWRKRDSRGFVIDPLRLKLLREQWGLDEQPDLEI